MHKYMFKKKLAEPLKYSLPGYAIMVTRMFGDSKINLCCGNSGESDR